MSHNCSGEHEHHESDHVHSHDGEESLGPSDSLYSHIDVDNVVAFNASGIVRDLFRPWDRRMTEQRVESEEEPEIIIRIPLTGLANLKALLLRAGPSDHTPSSMSIFVNRDDIDFTNVDDHAPAQTFDIPIGEGVGEYILSRVKFSNTTSITLSFPNSHGADTMQLYWIGLLGTYISERKGPPTNIVYEAMPNLADHQRIKGTASGFSTNLG